MQVNLHFKNTHGEKRLANKHFKATHGEKVIECQHACKQRLKCPHAWCDKLFSTKMQVNLHFKNTHGEKNVIVVRQEELVIVN